MCPADSWYLTDRLILDAPRKFFWVRELSCRVSSPRDEAPSTRLRAGILIRQKGPKPFPPVRGSPPPRGQALPGSSASVPNHMARKLAPLKPVLAEGKDSALRLRRAQRGKRRWKREHEVVMNLRNSQQKTRPHHDPIIFFILGPSPTSRISREDGKACCVEGRMFFGSWRRRRGEG